jgi:hypothetical protein
MVGKNDLINCPKIITVLLIALCFNCFSQHRLNASLGYGKSSVQYPLKQANSQRKESVEFGNSFLAGLGYKYQSKKLIGLGIDLTGSFINGTMLSKFDGTVTLGYSTVNLQREERNTCKFIYLSMPIYASFYYKSFSLDLGLQSSYAFYRKYGYSDKFIYSSNPSTGNPIVGDITVWRKNENSNLLKYDFGAFTAINFKAQPRLDLFIRYYKGLISLWEWDSSFGVDNLTNSQLIIGARYGFFVSKAKNNIVEKSAN